MSAVSSGRKDLWLNFVLSEIASECKMELEFSSEIMIMITELTDNPQGHS